MNPTPTQPQSPTPTLALTLTLTPSADWVRKYEVLGDIPNFEDRKTVEGFQKHRAGGKAALAESDGGYNAHLAARDLVVRNVTGQAAAANGAKVAAEKRAALELFYRSFIMGDEYGEAQHMAACGMLVRVRGIRTLLKRLRAMPERVRTARGPSSPPPPVPLPPRVWMGKSKHADAPYRRRHCQWRVCFSSKIVSRSRPSTSAVVENVFEPGTLVWSGPMRPDGWVELSERPVLSYILVDATPLGLGRLLELVQPPQLDDGACPACHRAPCYCEVLEEYGL